MDGILIIDKPAGITSHDVVARCRWILKTKRVGHTGTLDPFATGIVVILVGKATRLAQFLDKDAKEYEAVVRFGFETDTGDLTGRRKAEGERLKAFSGEEIENVLKDFRGEIEQTPPMYSAKKVEGKKLYELARKGVEIERKPVKVTIYELELIESRQWSAVSSQPDEEQAIEDQSRKTEDRTIRVVCSAGTYIRTLAEDIGRRLGTAAHLAALRRTRAGKFDLSQASTLEELEAMVAGNKLGEVLISMNAALSHLPEVRLSDVEAGKARNGMKLRFEAAQASDNQPFRLTGENENLIAVGFYGAAEKIIQPKVVLV
ncbi:MAG: tRNA pseudouridine(55) synthase TruB [Acidobacteriota bacterium]|nr:tRNA pseudouridine(55) synthase TruB [Acidobacteriota bacterium]